MIRKKTTRGRFRVNKIHLEDGTSFDSELEYKRWMFLKDAENRGEIIRLKRQVKFVLIPKQTILVNKVGKNGKLCKPKEKTVEHECAYYCDFFYELVKPNSLLPEPFVVIEDTKGFMTKEYIIKRKLMRFNGNPIREIKKYNEPILC